MLLTEMEQRRRKLERELPLFRGTTRWVQYSPQLFPNILLTEGVMFLASVGQCLWLVDHITSLQFLPKIALHLELQYLQFWTLNVQDDRSAELRCEWDLGKVVYTEEVSFTDFPLDQIRLYLAIDGSYKVIMLPSEY